MMANNKQNGRASKKTLMLTQFSVLLAIEAIFCFTPLGSLPALGPIVMTLAMLPVIITALLLGPWAGTMMGFFAGLFSFFVWTFMPPNPLAAFIFTPFYSLGEIKGNFGSLLICFIPRILVGTFSGLTYKHLSRVIHNGDLISLSISAVIGSLTNTILVMGGIWLFFSAEYSELAGEAILLIIGSTILTSGIPEAVLSAAVCPAVCRPVHLYLKKGR